MFTEIDLDAQNIGWWIIDLYFSQQPHEQTNLNSTFDHLLVRIYMFLKWRQVLEQNTAHVIIIPWKKRTSF